mgnify:CR=1 FL=1
MSIELLLYLAGSVNRLLALLYISGSVVAVAGLIGTIISRFEKYEEGYKFWEKSLAISVSILVTACLIPESKTIYMIAGASYSKEALQSETAVKIKKLIDGKLDEALAAMEKK